MKKIIYFILIFLFLISTNYLQSEFYDGIFIIINNDVITLNEYKERFLKIKSGLLKQGMPLPPNVMEIIFNDFVGEKLIQQVADRKEIFVSDMEVEESINRLRKLNRLSPAAFKRALEQEGKSLKELKEEFRKRLLNEKIMNIELRPRITQSSEEELLDYYKSHPKEMTAPPRVKVNHILIKDNFNLSLGARSKIKKKAKGILQRALKGENFCKLTKKYSEDQTSASVCGNIGWINEGEWIPGVDKILFSIRKGKVGKTLLQSRQGWHIVKVTDKGAKKLLPFKDMKLRIENYLIGQKMEKEFKKWLDEQKQNAYFEVIFPGDDKYVYDYNKWKKKNSKKVISNKKFLKKIKSIKI